MVGIKYNMKWLFLLILICLLDVVYSQTCTYFDDIGFYHKLYCSSGYCCGSHHHKYCCTNVPGIVGGVIGFCIFVGIIAAIVSCCCCACCSYYRGTRGTVITTARTPITVTTVPDYQATGGNYSGPYTAKPADAYNAPPPAYK